MTTARPPPLGIIMRTLKAIADDLAEAADTAIANHDGFAIGEHATLGALLHEYEHHDARASALEALDLLVEEARAAQDLRDPKNRPQMYKAIEQQAKIVREGLER